MFLVLAIAVCVAESWQRAKIKDLESGREAFQAGTTPAQAGPRYVLRRTQGASTSGAPIEAGTPVTVLSVDAGTRCARIRTDDDRTVLRSESAAGLLEKIRADYRDRPVSRQAAGVDRPETPNCRFLPEG